MAAPARAPTRAIVTPWADALLTGGLSLVVLPLLLLVWRRDGGGLPALAALTFLINLPHFLASYRIVYRTGETIRRYWTAALLVPGVLLVWGVAGIALRDPSPWVLEAMVVVGGGYLAWHYTGQAWGMMATFAYLGGVKVDPTERLLLRGGLRIMLVWHLTWFGRVGFADGLTRLDGDWPLWGDALITAYSVVTWLTIVSLALGLYGLYRITKRTGRLPPGRMLIPWAAIYAWYGAMAIEPTALFWVQIAHSLQYLIFPMRVEVNRMAGSSTSQVVIATLLYGLALIGLGFALKELLPLALRDGLDAVFGPSGVEAFPVFLLAFINIHHYFTDGCIWKISNPDVRKELFAHVAP